MRATLTTISVVALLAVSAGPAAAGQDVSANRTDAAIHATAMRSQGIHYRTSVPSPGELAPARVAGAPAAHDGFAWVDAGIGAGLAAALLLTAAGVSAVRRPPMATR